MKAVFITNIPAPYQIKYCSVLKQYGDITYIFCNDKNSDRPEHWKIDLESNCIMLNPKKKYVIGNERYLNLDIWDQLNIINPDIVIVGGFAAPTNIISYNWALKNKKKFVVFSEISRNPKNLKLYKVIYKKLDALMVCGKTAVKQFESVFEQKIYNYTYPADLENKFRIKRSYNTQGIRFLYASRFVPEFNPLMCIKAFAELRKKYNNISLLMSSNGELLDESIKLVAQLKLKHCVEFRLKLEKWEDVNKLFEDSDILIYPASFAGWGLVVPEAMAAGMPVITTRAVGASDLLPDNQIIECSEVALREKMEEFIKDLSLVRSVGIDNREKAESERFDRKAQYFFECLNQINDG